MVDENPSQIPEIDPLVPLIIDGDQVRLALPPQTPEDLATLDLLKPELLAELDSRLADYQGSNSFQASHFSPGLVAYRETLNRPSDEIPFPLLFARGMRIIRNFDAATAELARTETEWEPFKPNEESSLNTIIDLHSQIMSQTREGQDAISRAREQETSPAQQRKDAALLDEWIKAPGQQGDITAEETQVVLDEIADTPPEGPRASQTMAFKYATVLSLATVVLGGASAIGGTAVGLPGTVGVVLLSGDAIKNVTVFQEVRDDLVTRFNALNTSTGKAADATQTRLTDAFARLRTAKSNLLKKISRIRPEFRWLARKVDFTEEYFTAAASICAYELCVPNGIPRDFDPIKTPKIANDARDKRFDDLLQKYKSDYHSNDYHSLLNDMKVNLSKAVNRLGKFDSSQRSGISSVYGGELGIDMVDKYLEFLSVLRSKAEITETSLRLSDDIEELVARLKVLWGYTGV